MVCPQKLDERNKRVKTDGLDAKALCLKLDRFLEGNRDELAVIRVPSRRGGTRAAIFRQREQLVGTAAIGTQGRSLMVNHGLAAPPNWWKTRTFVALQVPAWMIAMLEIWQPILLRCRKRSPSSPNCKRCRTSGHADWES